MPKPANKKAVAPKAVKTKLNLQIREILGNAYSFVLGEQRTESVATVTLEVLMKERINQIEGTDGMTEIRLNKKDELEKLMTEVTEAVTTVKALPPEVFKITGEEQSEQNANTEREVPE